MSENENNELNNLEGRRPVAPLAQPVENNATPVSQPESPAYNQVAPAPAPAAEYVHAYSTNGGGNAGGGKKKMTGRIILVAVLLFVIIGGAVVFASGALNGLGGSNADQVVKLIKASGEYYSSELDKAADANKVFQKLAEFTGKSTQTTFDADIYGTDISLAIKNDVANKLLALEGSFVGNFLGMYLADTKLGISIGGVGNYYIPTDNLAKDVEVFAERIGLPIGSVALDEFMAMNFGYSAIFDPTAFQNDEDIAMYTRLAEKYGKLFEGIFDTAKYETSSGTIEIGDKDEKSKVIKATFSREGLTPWMKSLMEEIKKDEDIKAILQNVYDAGGEGYESYSHDFDEFYDEFIVAMDDMIAELDYMDDFEFTVNFYEYKGIIVKTEIEAEDGIVSFAATGGKYRLDRVILEAEVNRERVSVVIEGDIIDTAVISADISIKIPSMTVPKFSFEWDTTKNSDNLTLGIKGVFDLVLTFAVDGDDVVLAFDPSTLGLGLDIPVIKFVTGELAGSVEWPSAAENLFDFSVSDIEDLMYEIMSVFGGSDMYY